MRDQSHVPRHVLHFFQLSDWLKGGTKTLLHEIIKGHGIYLASWDSQYPEPLASGSSVPLGEVNSIHIPLIFMQQVLMSRDTPRDPPEGLRVQAYLATS